MVAALLRAELRRGLSPRALAMPARAGMDGPMARCWKETRTVGSSDGPGKENASAPSPASSGGGTGKDSEVPRKKASAYTLYTRG